MGRLFSVAGLFFGCSIMASTQATLPVRDVVVYAAIISILGGIASGTRHSRDWFVLLQYGLNTAVLGVSLVLMSQYWVSRSEAATWASLGSVGVLSLGGLTTVDWATKTLKNWVTRRSGDDGKKE